MRLLRRLENHRWVVWVAWPIAAFVLPILAIRVIAAVKGWGLYWAMDAREAMQTALVMFGPPILFEVLIRKGRNNR